MGSAIMVLLVVGGVGIGGYFIYTKFINPPSTDSAGYSGSTDTPKSGPDVEHTVFAPEHSDGTAPSDCATLWQTDALKMAQCAWAQQQALQAQKRNSSTMSSIAQTASINHSGQEPYINPALDNTYIK